jgi:hypothetical protein
MQDPRATHYWTDDNVLAEAFKGPLGIVGEPAWDTYMIYPPGVRWEDVPPAPAFFMVVEKPLSAELRLNVHTFAEEVRRLLGAP